MADDIRPSKTQRKKQMIALQDLGAELTELSDIQLAALALPENLHDALLEAKRVNGFEARRRQLQYVGKLMRGVDPAPIRAQLDAWNTSSQRHLALLARAEHWRERLLADEHVIAEFIAEHSHADAQQLRSLTHNALRERAASRPPAAYRALYRFLREALLAHEVQRGEKREA